MPHNQRLRITLMQLLQQHPQRTLLCLSASVLWSLAVGSQTADIAYPDAVVVMVLAVGTLHLLRPSLLNRPVRRNDIVIPTSLLSEGTVVAVNVRHPQCAALLVGRAMHDNHRYFPHKMFFYYPQMLNRFETDKQSSICLTSADKR